MINWLINRAKRTPYFHLQGYMNRYWLFQSRLVSIRIHQILRSDDGRCMHDHPWWNISIVLRGRYWEIMDGGPRWRGPGSVVVRRAQHRHRLVLPPEHDCWSLFIHGHKSREWGFHTKDGWVMWKKYLGIDE